MPRIKHKGVIRSRNFRFRWQTAVAAEDIKTDTNVAVQSSHSSACSCPDYLKQSWREKQTLIISTIRNQEVKIVEIHKQYIIITWSDDNKNEKPKHNRANRVALSLFRKCFRNWSTPHDVLIKLLHLPICNTSWSRLDTNINQHNKK